MGEGTKEGSQAIIGQQIIKQDMQPLDTKFEWNVSTIQNMLSRVWFNNSKCTYISR